MSRNNLLKQLRLVTHTMVQGGLSSTTRTCGQPSCPCHGDPARRHGPHLYFTWRSNGKAQALYVPAEHAAEAKAAQAAGARYGEIGLRLAALNRQQMRKRWSRSQTDSGAKRSV